MKNIAKYLVFLFMFGRAFAGTASLYDDSSLVSIKSNGNIYGYYASEAGMFSCVFLFYGHLPIVKNGKQDDYEVVDVNTFGFRFRAQSNFSFAHRYKQGDIAGKIFMHKDILYLKTEEPQGGCLSAAGDFDGGPGESGAVQYSVEKNINATRIAIITRKTYFYNEIGTMKRKGFLVSGDIVLVINEKRGYSYVRFVNPNDTDQVTTGWIRSADLVNPFPPS